MTEEKRSSDSSRGRMMNAANAISMPTTSMSRKGEGRASVAIADLG